MTVRDSSDSVATALAHLGEELQDPDAARLAAATFLDLLPGRMAAIGTGDLQAAHALAGGAHMLGLRRIALAARQVEDALRADQDPSTSVGHLVSVAAEDGAAVADYVGVDGPPIL